MVLQLVRTRLSIVSLLAVAGLLIPAARSGAHPGDEANIYHYLWFEARPRELSLQVALEVGGLLTRAMWSRLDTNGDHVISAAEEKVFSGLVAADMGLRIDGRKRRWQVADRTFPVEKVFFGGRFPETAIVIRLKTPLGVGSGRRSVELLNGAFREYSAVTPLPVTKGIGEEVSPPSVEQNGRMVKFFLGPGTAAAALAPTNPGQPGAGPIGSEVRGGGSRLPGLGLSGDRPPAEPGPGQGPPPHGDLANAPIFTGNSPVLYAAPSGGATSSDGHEHGENGLKALLGRKLTPGLILLGLAAAVLAGMVHALAPGHGKTMVAAYLVGSRGTVRDALVLGLTVTITHTLSVYVLGFLCIWLTASIRAEVVSNWLMFLSGVLVLLMGFWMSRRALQVYLGLRTPDSHAHDCAGHAHGLPAHGHSHEHAGQAVHSRQESPAQAAVSGGVPEPAATRLPPRDHPVEAGASPASERTGRLGRFGVVGLGIAGGMVPCVDALAILLAAVNLGSIWIGLAIIAAFSVGMALVLMAIGVVMVTAKDAFARFAGDTPLLRVLPLVSGVVVLILGIWLSLQGAAQTGLIPRLG